MDAFVGANTAHGEARPALACARDTRVKGRQPRGTPPYLRKCPPPEGRLRETGGHIRLPRTPPPLCDAVAATWDKHHVDDTLRPFVFGQGGRTKGQLASCLQGHEVDIQVGAVGRAGQRAEGDTSVYVMVGRPPDTPRPPYRPATL